MEALKDAVSRIKPPKQDMGLYDQSLRMEGLLYHANGDNFVVHPIPNMAYGDIVNILCCCEKSHQ